jgi:proliferating cell nuclear antigen
MSHNNSESNTIIFKLNNKFKITQFATIIQLFKACSETTAMVIMTNHIHIQVMDKSHVCLCECRLFFDWFDNTDEVKKTVQYLFSKNNNKSITFIFSSGIFHTIINSIGDQQILFMEFNTDDDSFKINIEYNTTNKDNINKYYSLPLIEQEQEMMKIPDTEYNLDFVIGIKTIYDIFSQMMIFSNTIRFVCDENNMCISSTDGTNGEMKVNINAYDFEEFSIDEGGMLDLEFSLTHLMKYCLTTKLVSQIKFCMSVDEPMKIIYQLDESSDSVIQFFIAAKMKEE